MKIENHKCPEQLETTKTDSTRPTLRSADNFIIPKSVTETFKKF